MCFVLQCLGPIQVPRWGPSRPVLVPSCSRAFLTGSGLDGQKQTSWPLPIFALLRTSVCAVLRSSIWAHLHAFAPFCVRELLEQLHLRSSAFRCVNKSQAPTANVGLSLREQIAGSNRKRSPGDGALSAGLCRLCRGEVPQSSRFCSLSWYKIS